VWTIARPADVKPRAEAEQRKRAQFGARAAGNKFPLGRSVHAGRHFGPSAGRWLLLVINHDDCFAGLLGGAAKQWRRASKQSESLSLGPGCSGATCRSSERGQSLAAASP